jgi:hypothetical protein
MKTTGCRQRHQSVAYLLSALLALGVLQVAAAHEAGDAHQHGDHAAEIIASAKAFVEALRPESREKATFEFATDERLNWHFIPRDRLGLPLGEMNIEERRAAHDVLRSFLSAQGYLKATSVMSLEAILREIEGPNGRMVRDQERYYFSVFGTPSAEEPWGLRVEGHHLSLNFSSVHGMIVSSAPMMFGANPAEVRSGPRAGLRVLAEEEDLARELVKSLSEAHRKTAIIEATAPRDVITVPGYEIDMLKPAGLAASEMSAEQAQLLHQLIALFANNLRGELAQQELSQLTDEKFGQVRFAWAGGLERGEGHYYRVHGPFFIIEYDNTQNDANHIHAVWHSLNDDFGLDTLRKHYEAHQHE